MKKSLFRGGVVALFAIGLMFGFLGTVEAKNSIFGPCSTSKKCQDKPIGVATLGGIALEGKVATSLQGRVYSHWADNPTGEILFGIQYWNSYDCPGQLVVLFRDDLCDQTNCLDINLCAGDFADKDLCRIGKGVTVGFQLISCRGVRLSPSANTFRPIKGVVVQ